jgi:hypothetical protein
MSSIWAFFYIVVHQINSDLQFVALIPLPAVAGIANALIQARIGLGKTIERPVPSTALSMSHSSPSAGTALRMTRQGNGTVVGNDTRTDFLEMKPAAV